MSSGCLFTRPPHDRNNAMDTLKHKILLVDDDACLLEAMQRNLEDQFRLQIATSAAEGLERVRRNGPFSVVISDMRMPGVDGVQFLRQIMDISPKTVRIMLTGDAHIENAISAVNEGHIFRFMTKPCSEEVMRKVLLASLNQYEMLILEKELLEKTLRGAIAMLCEILAATNPLAFSRTMRVQFYASELATLLNLSDLWQYDIAALLSQIGCVTLPADTLEKLYAREDLSTQEAEMFKKHPDVAQKLILKIPRLENVSRMIALQNVSFKQLEAEARACDRPVIVGAQILRVATDFDLLLLRGMTQNDAVKLMRKNPDTYNPALLDLIRTVKILEVTEITRMVRVSALRRGMILDEDIRSKSGLLIALKGQHVDDTVRRCLQNYSTRQQIKPEVRVLILQDAGGNQAGQHPPTNPMNLDIGGTP